MSLDFVSPLTSIWIILYFAKYSEDVSVVDVQCAVELSFRKKQVHMSSRVSDSKKRLKATKGLEIE